MTREELHRACKELHERQCRAHGIDPDDTMQQGVFNNLMQFVLDEWGEREAQLAQETPKNWPDWMTEPASADQSGERETIKQRERRVRR